MKTFEATRNHMLANVNMATAAGLGVSVALALLLPSAGLGGGEGVAWAAKVSNNARALTSVFACINTVAVLLALHYVEL